MPNTTRISWHGLHVSTILARSFNAIDLVYTTCWTINPFWFTSLKIGSLKNERTNYIFVHGCVYAQAIFVYFHFILMRFHVKWQFVSLTILFKNSVFVWNFKFNFSTQPSWDLTLLNLVFWIYFIIFLLQLLSCHFLIFIYHTSLSRIPTILKKFFIYFALFFKSSNKQKFVSSLKINETKLNKSDFKTTNCDTD